MLNFILPNAITSIKEAKEYLNLLEKEGMIYHPEDDANDIIGFDITKEEGDHLNKLMEDIYNLPGNDGKHDDTILFCPCEYIISISDEDYIKDMKAEDEQDFYQSLNATVTTEDYNGYSLKRYQAADIDCTMIFKDEKLVSSINATTGNNSTDRAKEKIEKVFSI
jgi:hypothetical protein